MDTKADTIASAARRWDAARLQAIRLKNERAAFICDREKESVPDPPEKDVPLRYQARSRPCWKTFVVATRDGDEQDRLPESAWCPTCIERQRVYLAMRDATKRRGVALRQMQQLLAAERKRLGFDERYERRSA